MSSSARTLLLSVCIVLALSGVSACSKKNSDAASNTDAESGTVTVSGAFALYPLMLRWSETYQKEHPSVRIDVSAGGAGKGMADVLSGLVDLGMVSRELFPQEVDKGAVAIAVAKDAVLCVISSANPFAELLQERGLTPELLTNAWIEESIVDWETLLGLPTTKGSSALNPIRLYTRADSAGAAEVFAALMANHRQQDLKGTGVFGDPGLVEAVRNDPLGVGYGNVNFVYDAATRKPVEGIIVVPLDVDGAGLSSGESFYTTRDGITGAISEGRYPSPPARELYLVTRGRPQRTIVKSLLLWILTDGQALLEEAGYTTITSERLSNQLEVLAR